MGPQIIYFPFFNQQNNKSSQNSGNSNTNSNTFRYSGREDFADTVYGAEYNSVSD